MRKLTQEEKNLIRQKEEAGELSPEDKAFFMKAGYGEPEQKPSSTTENSKEQEHGLSVAQKVLQGFLDVPGEVGTAVGSAAHMASGGLDQAAYGVLAGGAEKLYDLATGKNHGSFNDLRMQHSNAYGRHLQEQYEKNPVSSVIGDVAGLALPVGEISGAGEALGLGGKAIGSMIDRAATGAAYGGASGVAQGLNEDKNPIGTGLEGAAFGSVLGPAAGYAGEQAGKLAQAGGRVIGQKLGVIDPDKIPYYAVLLKHLGMSPEEAKGAQDAIKKRIAEKRNNPDFSLADVLGDQGSMGLQKAKLQHPQTVGREIKSALEERSGKQAEFLGNAVQKQLGEPKTTQEIKEGIVGRPKNFVTGDKGTKGARKEIAEPLYDKAFTEGRINESVDPIAYQQLLDFIAHQKKVQDLSIQEVKHPEVHRVTDYTGRTLVEPSPERIESILTSKEKLLPLTNTGKYTKRALDKFKFLRDVRNEQAQENINSAILRDEPIPEYLTKIPEDPILGEAHAAIMSLRDEANKNASNAPERDTALTSKENIEERLKRLVPEFDVAQNAWARLSSPLDYIKEGQVVTQNPKKLAGLRDTAHGRKVFRELVGRDIGEALGKAPESEDNILSKKFTSNYAKQNIKKATGSDYLNNLIQDQADMARTNRTVLGGSQTAEKESIKAGGNEEEKALELAHRAHGFVHNTIGSIVGLAKDFFKKEGGLTQEQARQLKDALLETNTNKQLSILQDMMENKPQLRRYIASELGKNIGTRAGTYASGVFGGE